MQDGGIERSRARFFDHFVTIFVFHYFPGSARTEFIKKASSHMETYCKNIGKYGIRPLIIIHFIMLIVSGSDQENFENLSSVIRKTVGAMRIVAKFRAERW